MHWDFELPWMLWLLPLALLPLVRRRSDTLTFSYLSWLPPDRVGRAAGWLWRGLAVLAMGCIVVGLARPGQSMTQVLRTGRGAEVLILLDRSSSMDAIPRGVQAAGELSAGDSKNRIVRELLARFVAKRPDDRFALTTFSTSPMRIVPFTQRGSVVQAGLAATGIGRGLPDTDLGGALQAAIEQFEGRAYSGSRIVLIVSDGGARLDDDTRRRIQTGLSDHRIGLYWIYVRSGPNSPDLHALADGADASVDEIALHRFFQSLPTAYRLYQADNADAIQAAIAEIDRQQNLPLTYYERLPRRDHSAALFAAALACCAALLACRCVQLRSWA